MTWSSKCTAFVGIALFAAACGPVDNYFEFSTYDDLEPGVGDVVFYANPPFYVVGTELRQMQLVSRESGEYRPVRLADAVAAVVIDDSLFLARPDGGIARTDNGRFTSGVQPIVSSEAAVALGTQGGALIALRAVSSTRMDILRSTDLGETFLTIGTGLGLEALVEPGSERFAVTGATQTALWAEISGDSDFGPGVQTVAATFEIRDDVVTQLPGQDPYAVPNAEGPDGLFAFTLPFSRDAGSPDAIPVGISRDPRPRPKEEAATMPLLHFRSNGVPIVSARVLRSASPDWLDILVNGHTLARTSQSDDFVSRSDESGRVHWGFGCERRERFEFGLPGEVTTVTVRNTQEKTLTLYAIDGAYRWHLLEPVSGKETKTVTGPEVRLGHWIQAIDKNGFCQGAQAISGASTEFLIWH